MRGKKLKKREYNDGCATAHALDIIGERWTLLVMRELMLGPKRFSDLRKGLPGISANVLTQRLESLEGLSILRRRKLPPPAASNVYELTDWGMEAEELMKVIGRWAARSPHMAGGKPMSVNSVVLSFRTMFSKDRAKGLDFAIGFQFGDQAFLALIADGKLDIYHGDPAQGDAVATCDQNALVGVVYGGVPLSDMMSSGDITVDGDMSALEKFCTLFPLPKTAETRS